MYFETEKAGEEKMSDLRAMSIPSMYQDNMSQDMNTDRDNGSEASTRPAEELGGCSASGVGNGKPPNSHCEILTNPYLHNPSLMFSDGVKTIDFVLVWEAAREEANCPQAVRRREIFEEDLENVGLILEREAPENLHGLNFVKIHAPVQVLKDYSEVLKLRMPTRDCSKVQKGGVTNRLLNAAMKFVRKDKPEKSDGLMGRLEGCWERFRSTIDVDHKKFPEKRHNLTAIYSKDKEYLFDTTSLCFWTPSVRSRIVHFILDRMHFGKLQDDGTYSASYPLHDGDLKNKGSMRYLLYQEWASVSKCIKYQPLDYVKDYFGVKVGLYFAWLGFYTHMLIPAAIVGLICVIYSASTINSNKPSQDVCNYNSTIKMCPLCDYICDYWNLKDTCMLSRITYLFDNSTTVFFAVFMSLWGACFLELWKRYSAEMTHRWGLTGFDVYEEHPRPQYLARLAKIKKKDQDGNIEAGEPKVPFWRMKLPATLISFSVTALLILMAIAAVLGVVLYRMSILGANILRQDTNLLTANPVLFTSATAACINLVLICVFNYIYQYLAEWLTEKEYLRTQTEFDDSLTLKIYLLQFVNYYASIFYIAFFKGKYVGRPGDYVRIFGHRQEECAPGGCFIELSIQLAIIMVGKQFINTIVEMMMPYLLKWWNIMRTIGRKNTIKSTKQWVKDFKLVDFGSMGLFPEYLEMVLQYGFVTIFVAAFPLAPLFALINNVLEMRLDAKKFLTCYRRPVLQRVTDIGVWYRILDSIGKLSVITNAFIIAFTSDFIPRLVYYFSYHTYDNYVNHTLADFNVTVFHQYRPYSSKYNETMCSYPGYWYSKEGDDYERSNWYWHIMGARLAFIVVFENVVVLALIIVRWAIPDMSAQLRERIRQENFVINRFIFEEARAASRRPAPPSSATAEPPPWHPEEQTVSNWNHIAFLSGSDFDLAAHGDHEDLAAVTSQIIAHEARSHDPPPEHV